MKYYFLSTNEDLEGGLLQSQFIVPITKYFKDDHEIMSINRPFFRRYGEKLAWQLNLLIPPRLLAYNLLCWIYLPWAFIVAVILQVRANKAGQAYRFVARGYLSGLICWSMNKLFGVPYVFDPRSLYPLESLTADLMRARSIPFTFWIRVEKMVISDAEAVVCVSSGMIRYYRRRYGCDRCVLIPCFNSGEIQRNDLLASEFRDALSIPQSKRLLLYFGTLNQGWNNIGVYHQILQQFPQESYHILMVTQDAPSVRQSLLSQWPNISILSSQELPGRVSLSDCFRYSDFGVVFMRRSRDWFTRLGVKFAEYTANGLPVIVNKWVGEAAWLIRQQGLEPSLVMCDQSNLPASATELERNAIADWSQLYFSPKNINRILSEMP